MHNHAPQKMGIYEFVSFDEQQKPKVVFASLVTDTTIFKALFEHWEGNRQPAAQDLLKRLPNLYFSYVVRNPTPKRRKICRIFSMGLCRKINRN